MTKQKKRIALESSSINEAFPIFYTNRVWRTKKMKTGKFLIKNLFFIICQRKFSLFSCVPNLTFTSKFSWKFFLRVFYFSLPFVIFCIMKNIGTFCLSSLKVYNYVALFRNYFQASRLFFFFKLWKKYFIYVGSGFSAILERIK